jgi:hypothetical protein
MSGSSIVDGRLLRNIETNGERDRLLFVLKSQGTAPSNPVREFVLAGHGVGLVDVHAAAEGMLAGSDLPESPRPAAGDQILAVLMAVRGFPLPNRKLGGEDTAAADRRALALCVDAASTSSVHAIGTVCRVCDQDLSGHVDLDVAGVHQQPAPVCATRSPPCRRWSKAFPSRRRIVGDLSDSAWKRLGVDAGLVEVSDGHLGPGRVRP